MKMGSVKEIIFPVDGPPCAKREDAMSLDVVCRTGSGKNHWATRPVLVTEDIAKVKRTYSVPPAEKISAQRTYYPNVLRRPRDLSLTTGDIYGTRPKKQGPKSKRRTDPLQPLYEMPGHAHSVPTEPYVPRGSNESFLLHHRDIEKSYKEEKTRNYTRDPNDASDIPYASSNYWNKHVKPYKYQGIRHHEESLERIHIMYLRWWDVHIL